MEARLKSRCAFLAWAAPVIALILFARGLWIWVEYESEVLPVLLAQGVRIAPEKIEVWQWMTAGLAGSVPLLLVCAALVYAGRVFKVISTGERISSGVARYLSQIAGLVFGAAVIKVPVDALVSLLLTINNDVGNRSISIGFSSAELLGVIAAGLLWAMAWTLREAVAIRQENDAFV